MFTVSIDAIWALITLLIHGNKRSNFRSFDTIALYWVFTKKITPAYIVNTSVVLRAMALGVISSERASISVQTGPEVE